MFKKLNYSFIVMYVEVGGNRPFLEKFPFSFVSLKKDPLWNLFHD